MHRQETVTEMYTAAAQHVHATATSKQWPFNCTLAKDVPHLEDLLKIHHIYFVEYMTRAIRQIAEYERLLADEFEEYAKKISGDGDVKEIMLKTALAGEGGVYSNKEVVFTWRDDALPKIDLDNLLARDIGKPVCFDATILGLDEHQSVPYKYRVMYTEDGAAKFGKNEGSDEDIILAYQFDKEYHIVLEEFMTDLRYSVMEQDDGVYSRKEKRRINGKLYTSRLVNMFERADKARVIGMLQKTKGKKRNKEKNEFDLYVRVIDSSRRKIAEEALLSQADIKMFEEDSKDPESFLVKLTQSLAPHIYGAKLTKAAGLLALVGSYGLGSTGRDQMMVYVVGNPGVGKSQIGRALAEVKPAISFYANFQQATARGMTFGQEEFDGRKILRAGICVLFRYVILNEFDKGTRGMRDDISDIMSDQLATYNRVPFNVSQHVDCTIIAFGNPKARVWKQDLSLFKNLMPIEAQMLDRLWIIRAKEEDAKERRKHAGACRRGDYTPPYTKDQLAGWIQHRSTVVAPDSGGDAVLERFFETFDTLRSDGEIELKFDARQETDVVRICRALARLLGFSTVDAKCAHMAIELYTQSLRTLQINVDEGDYNKTAKFITDKDSKIICFDTVVQEVKDKDGYFDRTQVITILADRFNHWASVQDADRYFEKLTMPPNQYIMEDANGWCMV